MERIVPGGDAGRHQTRTLSTYYQYMAGGGGMQLRFWRVGVRGRFRWKSDRRQVANRNNRQVGRLSLSQSKTSGGTIQSNQIFIV